MLAETFLKERFKAGIKQESERWVQWNNRRLDAAEKGKTFNEPPPSEQDDQKRQVST